MTAEHDLKLFKESNQVEGQSKIWTDFQLEHPITTYTRTYTSEEQEENGKKFYEAHPEIKNAPSAHPQERKKLSKTRAALIGAGLFAAGIGISAFTSGRVGVEFPTPAFSSQGEFPSLEGESRNGNIVLSQNEEIFQNEMVRVLNWVPDGPITYWTTKDGHRRYLLTGGQDNATYMLETDGKTPLRELIKTGNLTKNDFKEVFSPDLDVPYRMHYVGITSVLQIDKENPDHLFGITHNERRVERNASGTFTATVGLVESNDGGLSWTDKGPIITGDDPQEPGKDVSGAGQPTAIVSEGYAYIMYIDWARVKYDHSDQIYLARMKVNDNATLGNVEYFTSDNQFSESFDAKKMKSVIPVPEGSNLIYTALPSVSYNEYLNQYLVTGESDAGFWFAESKDLINWTKPEIFYDFAKWGGKPHSILQVGEKWDSYPTILDESKKSSNITGENGIFYHSSGDNVISHEPAALDFSIK